jgi:cell division protein FtsQ
MRRVSSSDIVITPDDRPGGVHRPRRDVTGMRGSEPKPAKPKRKLPRVRIRFTALQKLIAGGVLTTALLVAVGVLWHQGTPQRIVRETGQSILRLTADAGFRIEEITVSGRSRTPADQILAALGVRHGDPILGVNLAVVKDRLEAIPSVRVAAVERRLPGAVHLAIVERQPVALWQQGKNFTLVDRDGHQIPGDIQGFEDLPLVVGDGAPAHAAELMTMLASEPKLASRVKAAVRVGSRRWNLKFDDAERGLEVRLPESDAEAAWHRLAELDRERSLTSRRIAMIDLRLPDRLVLKPEHEQTAERQ